MPHRNSDKTDKIAIIGSAGNEFIVNAINEIRKSDRKLFALVNEKRLNGLLLDGVETLSFNGSINWWNISFLRRLRKIEADSIVVIVGVQFFHFNIFNALRLWMRLALLGKADLLISYPFDPGQLDRWENGRPCGKTKSLIVKYDRLTGWSNRKSGIDTIVLNGKNRSSTRMTIDNNGGRVTSGNAGDHEDLPAIAFFGGSRLFGLKCSDEETLPWIFQEMVDSHKTLNYSAPGFSNYQSYLMLKQNLAASDIKCVIFGLDSDCDHGGNNFPGAPKLRCEWEPPSIKLPELCSLGLSLAPQELLKFPGSVKVRFLQIVEAFTNGSLLAGRPDRRIEKWGALYLLWQVKSLCDEYKTALIIMNYGLADNDISDFLNRNNFAWIKTAATDSPDRELFKSCATDLITLMRDLFNYNTSATPVPDPSGSANNN